MQQRSSTLAFDTQGTRRRPEAWRLLRAASSWVVVLAVVWLVSGCGRAPVLVRDDAGIFTPQQIERITVYHAHLLADYDIDYRVVTVGSATRDINSLAVDLFESLKVGSLSKGRRGLLLVLDTATDKVRLEVSRTLEGDFPDLFVAYIQTRQMTEFFARRMVASGILATTELIVTRAQQAASHQAWEAGPSDLGSAGAGATSPARIVDPGLPRTGVTAAPEVAYVGISPQTAMESYVRVLEAADSGVHDSEMQVYTRATREMFKGRLVTQAQARNELQALRSCEPSATLIDPSGQRAVVRYPVAKRLCSPRFLVVEQGGWRVDLALQSQHIRFNARNEWFAVPAAFAGTSYEFAFADWKFHADGFPVDE